MKRRLLSIFDTGSSPDGYHQAIIALFLALCLSCIVGVYSIIKPLKDAVFLSMVGSDYQPWAKIVTLIFLPICIFFYSWLVDRIRRYQLVCFFSLLYAIFCLIFSYFLTHPVIGLSNTETSKWRILGWIFYLVIDVYYVLVVSTFWSFSNSISSPESAKSNYGIIVAVSKFVGVFIPIGMWLLVNYTTLSDTQSIMFSLLFSAIMLVLAAFSVFLLVKKVPGKYLHGYEAVYEFEKHKKEEAKLHPVRTGGLWGWFEPMAEGFKLMIADPYVFGIFGMVYSYQIIEQILDYQKNVLASMRYNNEVGGMFSFGLVYTAAFQFLGVFFALIGTRSLLRYLDVSRCLLIVPIMTGGLIAIMLFFPNIALVFFPHLALDDITLRLYLVFAIMTILRALNYGFNVPIREMLYIPTVKDIKFKAKSWTDSVGRTLSKASGATFNIFSSNASSAILASSVFSLGIVSVWFVISYMVGQRYNKTIREDKIIGQ